MTEQINIAIIGVGRWGVHLLRNFLVTHQVIVVAVLDSYPERLIAVKKQFNLAENILLTTEWGDLEKLPALTAVAIATPAITHYSLIKDALKQKYHVLAEKPLTLNPDECQELCELAENEGLILMVDHTYLFHPAVERGQKVVQSGQLGDLRYGYATRTHLGPVRQDVDALWDLAIHDLAIFNHWLGEVPIEVEARGTTWLQEAEGIIASSSDSLSDLVWIKLTYPRNFVAYIHLCWLNHDKQRRLGIVGSQGSLIFDEMSSASPLTFIHGEFNRQGNLFIPLNQSQETLEIENNQPLQRVCDRFVVAILENIPAGISSGWVGKELVEILTALTKSLYQGGKSIKIS